MTLKYYVVCLGAVLALAACDARVRTPGAEIKGDGYEIDINNGGSRHCPPGHAKKGWC